MWCACYEYLSHTLTVTRSKGPKREVCDLSSPRYGAHTSAHAPQTFLSSSFFFFNKFILFICFWPRWVFVAVQGLLIAVASLVAEHGL